MKSICNCWHVRIIVRLSHLILWFYFNYILFEFDLIILFISICLHWFVSSDCSDWLCFVFFYWTDLDIFKLFNERKVKVKIKIARKKPGQQLNYVQSEKNIHDILKVLLNELQIHGNNCSVDRIDNKTIRFVVNIKILWETASSWHHNRFQKKVQRLTFCSSQCLIVQQ